MCGFGVNAGQNRNRPRPRKGVLTAWSVIVAKRSAMSPKLGGARLPNDTDLPRSCRLGTYEITRLVRKMRRAVNRDPARYQTFEDEDDDEYENDIGRPTANSASSPPTTD
jgi:hypothetical protein